MKRNNKSSFDRANSAAFTGHRYYDFSRREIIRQRLSRAIVEAYDNGIRNFISGFATGIDLMAAQTVQSLKLSHPGMVLTAAIPFIGQADRFKPYDRKCYDELVEKADEVIVLSEHYYPRCFLDRDEFMVCNATQIIAYYDGRERGGTYYTIRKARDLGGLLLTYIRMLMNEIFDILVIVVVFRVLFAFLGAWWHGDERNDFRRDR